MTRKFYTICSFLLLVALLFTGCAKSTPEPTAVPTDVPTEVPTLGEGVIICQVTDATGMEDETLNALVWAGIEKAETQFGITGKYRESQSEADYEENINSFLDDDCDLIIASGFSLNDAVEAAAEANPDQRFYIVDSKMDLSLDNVKGHFFNVGEASFLAGYAAAGITKSAKVGTFGSAQIPTVTAFMDGFYMGVQYYNQQHDTSIQVLGWDPDEETGVFIGEPVSEEDALSMSAELLEQGADVIMPVVGFSGLGVADLILEFGNAYVVGVNTDWARQSTQVADAILTSVLKNVDETTLDVVRSLVEGTFSSGVTEGTLANGGVGLASVSVRAPSSTADVMSWFDDLKIELKEVEEAIITGQLQTSP